MAKKREVSAVDAIYDLVEKIDILYKKVDIIDSNIKLLNNKISKMNKAAGAGSSDIFKNHAVVGSANDSFDSKVVIGNINTDISHLTDNDYLRCLHSWKFKMPVSQQNKLTKFDRF